jgi:hypothetical protein
MKYAPQENRDQQQFMLETELARAASPQGFGAQTREQWQRLADALVEHGVLNKAPEVAQVFSADLPATFLRNGKVAWP